MVRTRDLSMLPGVTERQTMPQHSVAERQIITEQRQIMPQHSVAENITHRNCILLGVLVPPRGRYYHWRDILTQVCHAGRCNPRPQIKFQGTEVTAICGLRAL